MRVEKRCARAALLALAALACAWAAATAALAGQLYTLPPTDGACGMSLRETWADPFVRLVAIPVALPGALVGFLASVLLLWQTRLSRSIPVVFTVSVVVAGVAGCVAPFLGAIAGLIFAIGAMVWCRKQFAVAPGQ